jgi:hypothetical protein
MVSDAVLIDAVAEYNSVVSEAAHAPVCTSIVRSCHSTISIKMRHSFLFLLKSLHQACTRKVHKVSVVDELSIYSCVL